MKKIFTLICALAFTYVAGAQTNVTVPFKEDKTTSTIPEVISLKETEYDFGKIPQGKPVTHVFTFTNTGTTPLVLDNVQASCGCTTPEWSKEPVPAGATAKINVGYNAANDGPFTKFITITYNGTQNKQVTIKGEVWKTPTTSAPENSGLGFLKNQ
ncbi:MAG: hypothetical protein JWO92_1857 [Chitinophagaceae bacterium]|jgi:hypothetical protein|nr:hypothetical protein [Chitinophagaceae bacterium]MDB5223956.1 hypothetical protein [Chitinophagaceae bacterium]